MSALTDLIPRASNLYAPPGPRLSPQFPGFRDEQWDLDLPAVTVAANSFNSQNILAFDGDADYFIRELWFIVLPTTLAAVQPQDLRVRIRDGDGQLFTSDFCYAQDLNGAYTPPWPIRRGATVTIDYQNVNANTAINVQLVVKGFKRFPCPNVPSVLKPVYVPQRRQYLAEPAGKRYRDFLYPVSFDNSTQTDYLRFPIQTDNDADFSWRATIGSWGTRNNFLTTVGNVALTFYDTMGTALCQLNVLTPWNNHNAGAMRESMISNGGGRGAVHFPEVIIPRGGIIQVDVSFVGLAPFCCVMFALRGFKIYDATAECATDETPVLGGRG